MNSLKELTFEPHRLTPDTHFSPARIMSPVEVVQATRHHAPDARQLLSGRWMLCGDITANAFDELRRLGGGALPRRVSAFESSEGFRYGVIAHQLGEYQHRFLLPQWDRMVCEFVAAASEAVPHGYMLGRDGHDEAFVFFEEINSPDFQGLRHLFEPTHDEDVPRGVSEFARVLNTLGRCDAVPSFVPGNDVRHVSVSAVISTQQLLGLEHLH